MAKSAKKRKQNGDQSAQALKKIKTDDSIPVVDSSACQGAEIGNLIFADELETTTETLQTLAKHPELISSKSLKPFRTAVHDYWRVASEASQTGA